MLLNGGAGALSRTRERNAARLTVDYGNLRKTSTTKDNRRGRTRPQGGCTHRYPNCYAKAAAESARCRSLRYQTVGREPARPWCLFLCGCISSTVLPRHWHRIIGALCSMNSPCPVPVPIPSARKLFLHMRPLRGATSRSMRYIESVFSMPLRERCRSTYHRLTEHGGVPDRRTAWDLM